MKVERIDESGQEDTVEQSSASTDISTTSTKSNRGRKPKKPAQPLNMSGESVYEDAVSAVSEPNYTRIHL